MNYLANNCYNVDLQVYLEPNKIIIEMFCQCAYLSMYFTQACGRYVLNVEIKIYWI